MPDPTPDVVKPDIAPPGQAERDEAERDGAVLVPIDEVARRLRLRASAIRYYEQRGLVDPAARHSGRRWYGPAEVRRLAIIRYWQESGLMSLDEIGDILAGAAGTRRWAQVIQDRIEALDAQIGRMQAVRQHLEHIVGQHEHAPDGCPYYETLIWEPPGHRHPVPAGHHAPLGDRA
jgi:MerR family transcriptional regulator, copper efflux regulator